MPKFAYEALDTKGRVIHGVVEAPSVHAVVSDLKNIRYTVTNIHQQHDVFSLIKEIRHGFEGVNLYSLAIFTRQFATIFGAGLPIMRGIEGLIQQEMEPRLSRIVTSIGKDLREGAPLSKALSRYPRVFTPIYLSMVKAGEISGAMAEVMDRLAALLERDYALRQKVKSAMTYPIFIFACSLALTLGVVQYIFPKFMDLLAGLDVQLPLPTRIMVEVTATLSNPYLLMPLALMLFVIVFLLLQYVKTPFGKRQLDRILLDLPLLGSVNRKVAISRFCRSLGTLMGSGVPVIHALDIVSSASGNEVVNDVISEVRAGLKQGERLSEPLHDHPVFPPVVSSMIAVGEEAGNVPGMLHRLASFYEVEVEHSLGSFTAMLEPIMIITLSLFAAFVVISVFWPIYLLVGKF